jgi:hypothetical protein
LVLELVQMTCTIGLARTDIRARNNYNPFPSIPESVYPWLGYLDWTIAQGQ